MSVHVSQSFKPRMPVQRRPFWVIRSLLLEAGVPWSEVRAMAPVEALQRIRAIRAEAPKVRAA